MNGDRCRSRTGSSSLSVSLRVVLPWPVERRACGCVGRRLERGEGGGEGCGCVCERTYGRTGERDDGRVGRKDGGKVPGIDANCRSFIRHQASRPSAALPFVYITRISTDETSVRPSADLQHPSGRNYKSVHALRPSVGVLAVLNERRTNPPRLKRLPQQSLT